MEHLCIIVPLTTEKFKERVESPTTVGEILKCFAVLILKTRFELGHTRRNLWKGGSSRKYIPAPNFCTAMQRRRFVMIFSNVAFRAQPIRSRNTSSAQHIWMLVTAFLDAINKHLEMRVTTSKIICIEDSMVRWYGVRGHWIYMGLRHYVSIERKP